MSSKLEPAIWSTNTGQRLPCFNRCQLIIAWMSKIWISKMYGLNYRDTVHIDEMVFEMNQIWTADMKSNEAMIFAVMMQFLQLRREAWKIQDFNGVWTRDLAIPVRHSNQLSYEATDVGSWSFVGSNGPVRNESMMKWYLKWIKYELRIWNQMKLWSSIERRTGIARSRVQTPLKSWIFQASLRNCKKLHS